MSVLGAFAPDFRDLTLLAHLWRNNHLAVSSSVFGCGLLPVCLLLEVFDAFWSATLFLRHQDPHSSQALRPNPRATVVNASRSSTFRFPKRRFKRSTNAGTCDEPPVRMTRSIPDAGTSASFKARSIVSSITSRSALIRS